MADRVRYVMDRMAPLFKQLEQSGIFSVKEVKSIVQKRTDFEYLMMRFELTTADVEKYLHYEAALFELLDVRFLKYKRAKEGNLNRAELDLFRGVKIAFIQHRNYIFERATKKFARHFPFWHAHIAFLRSTESFTMLDRLLGRVLALYPHVVDFWIAAGLYELQQKQNIHAARVMMQRGLRVNRQSAQLWQTYFQLELWNVLRAVERQNLLLKKPIELVDANKAKIDEQLKENEKEDKEEKKDDDNTDKEKEREKEMARIETASEAPLLVVFKYATNALLDLDHDESFFEADEEEDHAQQQKDKITDLAKAGLDLPAKLQGLRMLCELHNASLSLSPQLSRDMETVLRLALHWPRDESEKDESLRVSHTEEQQTLIAELAQHLSLFHVKRSVCSSSLLDLLAAREAERETGTVAETEDTQRQREIVQQALTVFTQSAQHAQTLVSSLTQTILSREKASKASVVVLDSLSAAAANLLVSINETVHRPVPVAESKEGEEADEEDGEKKAKEEIPLETRREMLRENILNTMHSYVNRQIERVGESVDFTEALSAAQQWLQSFLSSHSNATAAVPVTPAKGKKGRKSVAPAETGKEKESLAEHTRAVESVKSIHSLLLTVTEPQREKGESVIEEQRDVVRDAVDLSLQCERHRAECSSLSVLSQLLHISEDRSATANQALDFLYEVSQSLHRFQETLPLGETVNAATLDLVAYWSELAVHLVQFCAEFMALPTVAKCARENAPLLSLHSQGEALLRLLVGSISDEPDASERLFFESVCRSIITNARLVKAPSRLEWITAYIENSNEDLDALQKAYEFVVSCKRNYPQLFAGISLDSFFSSTVESIDELLEAAAKNGDNDEQHRLQEWSQHVLEKALEDGFTHYSDRLVEVYRQQGKHAQANHVLFKRRRLE